MKIDIINYVKDEIMKDFKDFLNYEKLEANEKSIELYITAQYYDLVDNLYTYYEYYPEMEHMTFENQVKFIEDKWEKILKETIKKED